MYSRKEKKDFSEQRKGRIKRFDRRDNSCWIQEILFVTIKFCYCRLSNKELEIDPEGNVLLCDIANVKFSNACEKGILEACKEQEADPLVKSLTCPKLPEPCSSCELKQKCRGGCFARAELILGDISAPDPLCPRVAGLI